jgi:hypothetical protein
LVENEQWVKADVPVDFQLLVDQIVDAGKLAKSKRPKSEDGGENNESNIEKEEDEMLEFERTRRMSDSENQNTTKSEVVSNKQMNVDGSKYFVPASILPFTKMMTDYLHCIENMPSIVTEIIHKVIDIFKVQYSFFFPN